MVKKDLLNTSHISHETNQPQFASLPVHPLDRSRNAKQTRAALLAAARLRFSRDGYGATSLRDIAADVGVNAALIPRYFGSKNELFQAVVTFNYNRIAAVVQGTPEQLGMNLLTFALGIPTEKEPDLLTTLLRSSDYLPAVESLRTWLEVLSTELAKGSRAPDVDLRADLIVAFIIGMVVLRRLIGKAPLSEVDAKMILPFIQTIIATLLPSYET